MGIDRQGRLAAVGILVACVGVASGAYLLATRAADEVPRDWAAQGSQATKSFEALTQAGLAAYQAGDLPGAEEAFRAALALRPDDAAALFNVGTALAAQGDQSSARDLFAAAVAADPTSPDAQFNLGVVAAALGDEATAEKAYRAAIVLRPETATASWNLGLLLYYRGDLKEGRRFLRAALDLDPTLMSRLPADVLLEGGKP